MVSKAFFTGSKYLVEENDGRYDMVRYDGERFLAGLSAAGQKVVRAPFDADEQKASYLQALVRLDENYSEAREYEDEAKGRYYKHDERAERHFRFKTAERFSGCVDDLHCLLSAHDDLIEVAVERVARGKEGSERQQARSAIRATLLACTDRAINEGWYPIVESYYYSLSPGELVAEDRERRKQRIEGTESSEAIRELLGKPHFRRLNEQDLRRIRTINRESPGGDARTWKRLLDDYHWFLGSDDDRSAAAARRASKH